MFPPKWWETKYLQCYLIFNFPACAIYRITSWQLFYGMQCAQGFPSFLGDLIHLNMSSLFVKNRKKYCTYSFFFLQPCPTFPAFLQSVLQDSVSGSASHPMTYMCTHVKKSNTCSNKEHWNVEMSLVSRVPKAFWRNPRADLSLQPSKRRWGLAYWFVLPWYYKWIFFLHLYISITNVKLTQPRITSQRINSHVMNEATNRI